MYGLRRTVEPVAPALDLAALKTHLRIFDNSQDGYLQQQLMPAVAEDAEAGTHRQLLTATYELTLDTFPCAGRPILLPKPPLQSVTSITYIDGAGVEQTWAAQNYRTIIEKEPGEIWPAWGRNWPATRPVAAAVTVTFVAGYGASNENIPPLLRNAMFLFAGHLFMNREGVVTGTIATVLPRGIADIYERFAVGDDFTDYHR